MSQQNEQQHNLSQDHSGRSQMASRLWWIWAAIFVVGIGLLLTQAFKSSGKADPVVVAYCAQDQVYAEPIFRDFENETGISVRPVYDSEAVKTVGLANRLLAERHRPQCDVFWGNEEMRTRQLAAAGVFRKTNGWAAFGYRSRRIVINTNEVIATSAPGSLLELTNALWRGKVALGFPQFGTTATHFHALRQAWGDELWQNWCRALAANEPVLVDGNSVVVDAVGEGRALVGLTDSDDIAAGEREGLPVAPLPITEESLLIPNTVGLIEGAPHPEAAEKLIAYLQRRETCDLLVANNALEAASNAEPSLRTLRVDWDRLLQDLENTTATLNQIFLR